MTECPNCSCQNSALSLFCEQCGKKLPADPSNTHDVRQEIEDEIIENIKTAANLVEKLMKKKKPASWPEFNKILDNVLLSVRQCSAFKHQVHCSFGKNFCPHCGQHLKKK